MSDLKKCVADRKKRDREFAEGFDEGYSQFKIGLSSKGGVVGKPVGDRVPPSASESSRNR